MAYYGGSMCQHERRRQKLAMMVGPWGPKWSISPSTRRANNRPCWRVSHSVLATPLSYVTSLPLKSPQFEGEGPIETRKKHCLGSIDDQVTSDMVRCPYSIHFCYAKWRVNPSTPASRQLLPGYIWQHSVEQPMS